jgi:hypothetical protein
MVLEKERLMTDSTLYSLTEVNQSENEQNRITRWTATNAVDNSEAESWQNEKDSDTLRKLIERGNGKVKSTDLIHHGFDASSLRF